MSLHQRVTIKAITDDAILVELPSGEELHWECADNDETSHFTVGDEVILTLTTGYALLNELMTTSNGQETPSENGDQQKHS